MSSTVPPLTVIANPRAGRGRRGDVLARVRARLDAGGADVDYLTSNSSDHAEELAEAAVHRRRTIVACGGDGHVGRLASVAARRSVPLGLVPIGVGNDFAAEFGLAPDQPECVADTLLAGAVRTIDVGRVGDRLFCGVAGCGFAAQANEWANRQRWIGGTALYIASVVKTLATYRPCPLRLTIDGDVVETSAWLVAVANARALGGGMLIAPDARLDDGALDVVVVGPVSRIEFLRTFPKVFTGRHVEHPQIAIARGAIVDIEPVDRREARLAVYADGERAAMLPSRFEAIAKHLQVLVPGP